jgi:hypothetical protein
VVLGAAAENVGELVDALASESPGVGAERRLIGHGAVVAAPAPGVGPEDAVAALELLAEDVEAPVLDLDDAACRFVAGDVRHAFLADLPFPEVHVCAAEGRRFDFGQHGHGLEVRHPHLSHFYGTVGPGDQRGARH